MGTLSLALTGIDPTSPIPGVVGEIRFAQGDSAGDQSPVKVLIIAPKTSAGSITAGSQIVGPLSDESDIITYLGAGSPAHRMGKRFLSLCKLAKLYFVAPAEATGSAATDEITFAFSSGSAPTAAGVATVTICGVDCSFAYTTSSTATNIAEGVKLAINAHTELPVSATNSSGVLTIAGKIAGTELNSVRFRSAVTAGTNVTTTVTADTALGASGAGAAAIGVGTIVYTTALATALATKFNYIVAHTQEATPILAAVTQVNTQALPATGFRQQLILGGALTPSAATTLASGANLNAARAQFVNQEQAPEEHYMGAATMAAVRVANETADPGFNFDGYGTREGEVFPIKRPYNDAAIPTAAELDSMLRNGVTPIGVAANDTTYIVRSITTRCYSASNIADYRVRDTNVVTTGDKFLGDVLVKLALSPWRKITDDPANTTLKQPPGNFATPKRVRASIETEVRRYVDEGWFDPAKLQTALDSIQVGIDPSVSSRMNIRTPAYASVNLHQQAVLVAESSPPV